MDPDPVPIPPPVQILFCVQHQFHPDAGVNDTDDDVVSMVELAQRQQKRGVGGADMVGRSGEMERNRCFSMS